MSTVLQTRFVTPEEYLAAEQSAERKSEYLNGEVFAMAGTTRHNPIVTNLVGELRNQLRKLPCDIYSQDLRVRVSATALYTYPDVIVTCAEEQFADGPGNPSLLNPVLLIEVLSESTGDYDRGQKFEHYRTLQSIREYLMVDQAKMHVEHWQIQRVGSWLRTEFSQPGDSVNLVINAKLSLTDIYEKVLFEAPESRHLTT
jgi:Uma2 family endonuclease